MLGLVGGGGWLYSLAKFRDRLDEKLRQGVNPPVQGVNQSCISHGAPPNERQQYSAGAGSRHHFKT